MGLAIGSIGRTVQAAGSYAPTVEAASVRAREAAPGGVNPLRTQAPSPFAEALQPKQGPPQAGFGSGTVSPPGAAIDFLGRGVRNIREALPTLAERRDEIRERFDGLRELQRNAPEAPAQPAPVEEPQPAETPQRAAAALEDAAARSRAEQFRPTAEPATVLRRAEAPADPQYVDLRV